jgi:DNA-binding LacI/PurR family transcriptional regulator
MGRGSVRKSGFGLAAGITFWIAALAIGVSNLGCRKHAAEAEPAAPAAPSSPRVSVLLGEPIDGFEPKLLEAARARGLQVEIESSHGHVDAQLEQIGRALERKPAALLLGPIHPDTLQRTRSASGEKQVPFVSLLHGDGKSGSWVGVPSTKLAREAGERAGRVLLARGITRPRVFAVEDGRWPESQRRVEATLKGIEATCGGLNLMLRVKTGVTPADTSTALQEGLRRAHEVEVLVAGDRLATAGAELGARASQLAGSLLVVGVCDDPQLVAAAKAPDAKLIAVAWTAEELARQAVDAVATAIAAPGTEVQREIACELIGPDAPAPKKDGP